nr:reverse transcriptase domain-containing protein [Tanacetum cinerariifolium]
MFDELLNGSSKVVSKSAAVSAADASSQRQNHTTPLNIHTTPAPTCHVLTLAPSVTSRSGLRTASTAAKPCQGDSLEFYLIRGSIYTDQRGTVVLATLFNGSEQRHFQPRSKYAEPVPKHSKSEPKSANSNGRFDRNDVQIVAPVSAPMPNLKPSIPYPSRRDNEKHRDQANEQIEKFYEIFKDMSFEIIFTDALTLLPKFASTLKALIRNKEKLNEMARTPMNKHYLGTSINIMPFSVWEALSLPKLTPTCMTLELVDRSVSKPIGIPKDVSFKVGVFQFPADFVVVDFEPDPRVPLILGRCFLKTSRALIDVHKGELTLRIGKEAITYNLDQLPTPADDPIVSTTSPTLTPFGDSDFLLFEEADAFLGLEDDPDSLKINPFYYDPEGDILLLEAILNREPLPPFLNHEKYLPSYKKELKVSEAKTIKSSIDEPPEVELKDLHPDLEYAFLEGDNKLPIIIAKELGDEEKFALIKRRVNPKIHDVIKKEVEKLLDAGLIYLISDSPWVSPIHCVPKKGGFTVVENEENELIMLERLAGNEYYCFLDGFSRYFQIPIDPRDQEKTTFTCPYGTFAYRRMPFGLCNAPGTFQRCMLAIFHDMVEKTMEIFMDDFLVLDTKGAENLAADHLSRLENPYENVLNPKEINETFPLETLSMVTFRGDSNASWFADFANYNASNFIVKGMTSQQKTRKLSTFSRLATMDPRGDILVQISLPKKSLILVSSGLPSTKMPMSLLKTVTRANDRENFHNRMRCLKIPSKFMKSLTFGALTLWARSRLHEGTNIFSWPLTICQNGLKQKRFPPMTPELFANS